MKTSFNSPSLTDRLSGMVWGSLAGDAACLGSHWVYGLKELARLFPTAHDLIEGELESISALTLAAEGKTIISRQELCRDNQPLAVH
jgi:hypothetical protein